MQVGTRGKYLRWTGGDNRLVSDAGSPGVKSNVSSEWIEYSNARSPSYCIITLESRSGKREKEGECSNVRRRGKGKWMMDTGLKEGKKEFEKGKAG